MGVESLLPVRPLMDSIFFVLGREENHHASDSHNSSLITHSIVDLA